MISPKISFVGVILIVLLSLMQFQLVMLESVPSDNQIAIIQNNRIANIISDSGLWNYGIVPYSISPDLEPQKCLIESVMLYIMMQSCVHFQPQQSTDPYYVRIGNGSDHICSSSFGQSRFSTISFGTGCDSFEFVLHHLMNVLGLEHEDKVILAPFDVNSLNDLYKCHLRAHKACAKLILLEQHLANCGQQSREYVDSNLVRTLTQKCHKFLN